MALITNCTLHLSSSLTGSTKDFRAVALKSAPRNASLSSRRQLRSVRMEGGDPNPPSGLSGIEAPLGVYTSSAPLEQDGTVPVGQRIAYICQDCGYVYNLEETFQDQPESYNCPVCKAPKSRFKQENAVVDDVLDVTKNEN